MKSLYTLGITTLLLLSGCQNNDETVTSSNSREFTVTTNISRACVNDDDMNKFSLFIDQTGNDFDYKVVMKKGENSIWNAFENDEQTKPVKMEWGDNNAASVSAVYSDNEIITDLTVKTNEISLPSVQQTDDMKKYDVLTFSKNLTNTEKKSVINILFKHLLCKISVTPDISAIKESGYSIKSISLNNIKNSYTWTPVKGSSTLTAIGESNNNITFVDNGDGSYESILVPQSLNSTVKLLITLQKVGESDIVQEESFETGTNIASGDFSTIDGVKIDYNKSRRVGKTVFSASGQLSVKSCLWEIK